VETLVRRALVLREFSLHAEMNPPVTYPYRYAWHRMGRKGHLCRVLVRARMNSCLIEFEDGHQAVTSRNALRKAKP
jgi:hypothetical protein